MEGGDVADPEPGKTAADRPDYPWLPADSEQATHPPKTDSWVP